MPKFYDNKPGELWRMPEDQWFEVNQELILWLANTPEGRQLLEIPSDFHRVDQIAKNRITMYLGTWDGEHKYKSDFRIGSKWANLIRYKWDEFLQLAEKYQRDNHLVLFTFGALVEPGATLTAYPDPDPETSTVDGWVVENTDAAWATIRADVGDGRSDNNVNVVIVGGATHSFSSPLWTNLYRGIFLFDTSAINEDNINSATLSFSRYDTLYDDIGNDPAFNVYTSAPASNTSLANGDYDSLGSTALCDDAIHIESIAAGYNDFVLNATGEAAINKTGITKLGCRESVYDADGGTPTWSGGSSMNFRIHSSERAGTGEDPKFVVVHGEAEASPAPPKRIVQSPVGSVTGLFKGQIIQ